MSSPGGEEIGRLSIRIVPDSSGFRSQLQRDLNAIERGLSVEIPVEFDVDVAGLRAQLAALDNSRVTIPVNLDLDTARFRAQIEALDSSRITIPVDLDLQNLAQLRAQLQTLRNASVNIRIRLHGISQALAQLTALDAVVRRLDGRDIDIRLNVNGLAGAVTQLAGLTAALAALRALGSGGGAGGSFLPIGGLPGILANAAQMAVRLGAALAQASVVATALAVGGAAITAAWGGISTAVASIPAAIALIAAPLGTVMAGLDGIKRAAATIKPEFDALRASVSATFERGLVPVFDRLATTFPTLQAGMNGVAESLVGIAGRLTEMVASEPGIARLNSVFANVKASLDGMAPGIAATVDSLLILASQSGAFDAITTAVNEFGTQFRANVLDLIADGTLDAAFRGLADLTGIAARGFADLVTNGIELFAAAAPGVNAALESITGFFNRFDWASLGTSVGGVFQGLADAINSVPQGTIDAIEASFARLAQTFQSADFQAQITTMIAGIPAAIDLINQLVQVFGTIGAGVSIAIQAFQRIAQAVTGFANILHGAGITIMQFGRMLGNPWQAWLDRADIGAQFDRAGALVREGVDKVGRAFTEPWPAIGASAASAAASATGQIPESVLAPLRGVPGAINTLNPQIAAAVSALGGQSANAAERSMQGVPPAVVAPLQPIPGQVTGALAPAEAAAQTSMQNITNVLTTSSTQWGPAVATGLQGITTALQTGTAQWSTTVGTAMTGVSVAITTGLAGASAAATTGITAVTTAIAVGTAQWYVAVSQGMTVLQTTVALGFTNLTTAATTGMTQVQTAITTGAATWAAAVSLGMATLANTVTLGFVTMQAVAAAGMLTVATAITAGFASVNASIAAGMAAAVAAVTAGMAAIQAAFVVNWAGVTAATTAAMAAMVAAMTAGMAQMVAASQQGWQQMTAAAQQGATQMTNAITQGMNQSVTAVVSGIARMVSALNSAVGQFRAAGAAMGQGLVDGLNSKLGAVQAAARRLADAAAAATRAAAEVRSPSRVFLAIGDMMGAGLELGIEARERRIISAARSIVDGLNTEFSRVDTADVTGAFDDIGGRMHARVMHSTAEIDAALVGAGAAGTGKTINNIINNYVPDAERGADKALHGMRRLEALGLFGE